MNIIFFTQEDPFYVKIFFDEFMRQFKSLEEIKAIVISNPMGKKELRNLIKQMYNFYGMLGFLRMGIRYAFFRMMSKMEKRLVKRENPPKTYSLRQLAKVYGLNVIERNDLNSEEFIQEIKAYEPDLFISVASPIIFKEDLIKIPKIDCINIHNAPLPKYRGMLPNFWQLFHGEATAGITIHKIDKGIDTGKIVAQELIPIGTEDSLDSLIKKTKKESASLLKDVIEKYRQGSVGYREMSGNGTYYSFPTRNDVEEFKRRGKKLY